MSRNRERLNDDELFTDWVRWIKRVHQEVLRQAWRHKMFRLLRGIYEQNPELQRTGSFFVQWAANNYVAAAAMALRRELDGLGGAENLVRLLHEMRQHPQALSRKRFRSTWRADPLDTYTADHAFDELRIVRHPESPDHDHIDPAMMVEDLARLDAQADVLIHIETTVAHRMPELADAKVPTFGELHAAADAVGEIFERYYRILTHSELVTREPMAQFNIYAPFRFAWMADEETFDYERCK